MTNFNWFMGVVEDTDDPMKGGRLKVRVLNEHFDRVATEDLPWATVMLPITSASYSGIGTAPVGAIEKGTNVVGFYADGTSKRIPVIVGTLPFPQRGSGDTNYLAKGQGPIEKQLVDGEPESAYAAEYPYNATHTTRSGHAIELDDTPGAERIHVYHKSGAYVEIFPDGQIVTKSPSNNVEVTVEDKEIRVVRGDMDVKVSRGGITIDALGHILVTSATRIDIIAPKVGINP